MLNQSSSPTRSISEFTDSLLGRACPGEGQSTLSWAIAHTPKAAAPLDVLDDDKAVEWSEEDIVLLHWRLLKKVGDLRDPETPLEEKLDTLRWIFTERDKESRPFSFVSCLRVVGCSPLSPTPYFGLVDAEEIRDAIRYQVKAWINATLERYPSWVRKAVLKNPEWVESRLGKNPQWINEQVKKHTVQGDLFA